LYSVPSGKVKGKIKKLNPGGVDLGIGSKLMGKYNHPDVRSRPIGGVTIATNIAVIGNFTYSETYSGGDLPTGLLFCP
jgi:hypothetical protein